MRALTDLKAQIKASSTFEHKINTSMKGKIAQTDLKMVEKELLDMRRSRETLLKRDPSMTKIASLMSQHMNLQLTRHQSDHQSIIELQNQIRGNLDRISQLEKDAK